MMIYKKYKAIIGGLIITSLFFMPLGNAFKAKAQISANGQSSSVGQIMDQMSPLMQALPGCIAGAYNGIKEAFSKGEEIMTSESLQVVLKMAGINLTKKAAEKVIGTSAVPTYDEITHTQLIENTAKLDTLLKKTEVIKTETKSINKNQTCLDAIGKAVVKILINKLTVDIVTWIQEGKEGKPFWLTDPSSFFKDIAKEQILTFGIELSDSSKFPFAKNFLMGAVNSFNKKFQDNAQYTLNKVLQQRGFTDVEFFADFSSGGWDGWNALIQNPANNPLGFNMLASNELSIRLEGTNNSPANLIKDALQQAGGFLGDERCVSPVGVTKEEHEAALKEMSTTPMGPYQNRECKKWEYVTPGKTISDTLTKAMNNRDHALLDADTLNDAIAAIMDAVLARMSSELAQKGLDGLSKLNVENNYDNYNYGDSYFSSGNANTLNDYSSYQLELSSWLNNHPNFNIRTDLNQALIDEQRTYVDKLKELNYALQHEDSSTLSGYNGLLPTIYQLDYCIPGAHPGWEDDSRNVLNAALKPIPDETEESLKTKYDNVDEVVEGVGRLGPVVAVAVGIAVSAAIASSATMGAAAGSIVPGLGTIIGAAVGVIIAASVAIVRGAIKRNGDTMLRTYYAGVVGIFTGLHVDPTDKPNKNQLANNLTNKQDVVRILNNVLDRYIKTYHNIYKKEILPSVTSEAAVYYKKIQGYQLLMAENQEKIDSHIGIVKRLEELKIEINTLNFKLTSNLLNQEQYEEELIPFKNSFARISTSLASGSDIAQIDNLKKGAEDETHYVYTDLLKGPFGCEKELEKGLLKNWKLYVPQRPPYPAPILYDYNNLKAGDLIPDRPEYPAYNNRMLNQSHVNTQAPGFLNGVFFIHDDQPNNKPGTFDCWHDYSENGEMSWMLDCRIGIEVPLDSWDTSLGRQNIGSDGLNHDGFFETSIGIY